jgi:hypothetical protein
MDVFGAGQGVGNKNIIRGNRLPGDRMMLADPGFGVTKRIGSNNLLQIFLKA